jgi:hypothetical protein
MHPEIFESGIISSILAWLSAIPLMFAAIALVFTSFVKHEGIPLWLSFWFAICLLIFSPVRYLLFLVVAADCYAVQSWGAFFSCFVLALYVPVVFGILYLIGVGLPIYSLGRILGKTSQLTVGRGILASVVFPLVCIVSSFIFYSTLPYAGWTVHWLKAKDVIRATNGPAAIVFRYFTSIGTPVTLPAFYDQTPQQPVDKLRCHTAAIFLSNQRNGYFVMHQYPDLYQRLTKGTEAK